VIRLIHSRLRVRLICTLLFFLPSPFSAQQTPDSQSPQANEPTATFTSRSDLVLVPVVVRDHEGKHVAGLGKDAFHLEENKKEQTISLFEEVHSSLVDAQPYRGSDRGFSNLPFNNAKELRHTILVLDLLNTSMLQREDGRNDFIKLLEKGVTGNQPVSLLCITSKGLKLVRAFATDPASVIADLKKLPLGAESIVARVNRVIGTIGQIRDIAQAYAGIPGRKTLVFAASDLPELATEDEIVDTSPYAGDLRRMWKGLNNANIAIYPVILMDWARNSGNGPISRLDVRVRNFAEATGGNECLEANELLRCLTSAVEDSRSYYMLGFSVQPDDRKPGWRDLKVRVAPEHVDVHARDGFYYGMAAPTDPNSAHEQVINALASSLPVTAVPMFVKALPPSAGNTPAAADKKTIQFLFTIPLSSVDIDMSVSPPLSLDLGAIALTRDTREAGEFVLPVRGNPKPENLQTWQRDGIKVQQKLDLPPGFYDMRCFTRDNNTGQIGTVVFPLEVR
jgi:VWFA-related protein